MEDKFENWKTKSPMAECVKKMYEIRVNNGDVTIKVGEDGSEVKADRFILVCRSIVLSSMLKDKDDKTTDVLIVNDIKKETFEQFLEFLYTDKTTVTKDNMEELLFCADKFKTKLLTKLCTVSLSKIITSGTICEMIRISERFQEKEMIEICLKSFEKMKIEGFPMMLFTRDFLQMCPSCVFKIVEDDEIFAQEELIFNCVLQWSRQECCRQQLPVTRENQRRILKKIRFPIMRHQFLNDVICESHILTSNEKVDILRQQLETRSKKFDTKRSMFICSERNWVTEFVRPGILTWDSMSSLHNLCPIDFSVSEFSVLFGIKLNFKDSSDYNGRETHIITLIRSENDKKTQEYATPVFECLPKNYVELSPRFVISLHPKVKYKIAVVLGFIKSALEGNEDTQFVESNRMARCDPPLIGSCIKRFCIAKKNKSRPKIV